MIIGDIFFFFQERIRSETISFVFEITNIIEQVKIDKYQN